MHAACGVGQAAGQKRTSAQSHESRRYRSVKPVPLDAKHKTNNKIRGSLKIFVRREGQILARWYKGQNGESRPHLGHIGADHERLEERCAVGCQWS